MISTAVPLPFQPPAQAADVTLAVRTPSASENVLVDAIAPVSEVSATDNGARKQIQENTVVTSPVNALQTLRYTNSTDASSSFATQIISQFLTDGAEISLSLTYEQLIEYSDVKFKPSNAGRPVDGAVLSTFNVSGSGSRVASAALDIEV